MEVRLLGPVELWRDGREVRLGTPQQRLVLAALAIAPGEPVAVADLVTRVWGDGLPGDARNVLQTHVSRLRGLVAGATGVPRSQAIRRTGDSYLLAVAPEQVDLCRARQLVADARRVAADGPAGDRAASALARQAAELRRGTPLAGLRGGWVEQARAGIEQEWLGWQVDRFEAELRLGQPEAVAGPLSALLTDHPLDERLAQLLMLALYRTGQQSEALRVYGRIRQRLIEELGDEPGSRLQRLHQQVLRRDPQLDHPSPPAGEPVGSEPVGSGPVSSGPAGSTTGSPGAGAGRPVPVRPRQLPPEVPNFTGRASKLRQLDSLLHDRAANRSVAVISAVAGMAGVGKTALAIYWGHRVRDQFPDGQLYVDLRGYAPGPPRSPASVLAAFLRSLGVAADQVPVDLDEAAALYRSLLADRMVLIVLDNAADSAQIRPLLPGASRSVVLVTSRAALPGLVVREGAHRLDLDLLTEPESVGLLAALLGPDRAAAEPAAVAELAQRCAYLPLALRVAAASLPPGGRVADLVAQLRDRGTLPVLAGAGEADVTVPAVFDLSYTRLPAPTQRAFRLLGLVPGPDLTAEALAALTAATPAQAEVWLAELARLHLVKPVARDRYVCHDLLREYAAGRAQDEDAGDWQAALTRLNDYYLSAADAATNRILPHPLRLPPDQDRARPQVEFADPDEAVRWLDAELPNLVAAAQRAAADRTGDPAPAWLLSHTLIPFLRLRGFPAEAAAIVDAALVAAEAAGERRGYGAALLGRASLHHQQGRWHAAVDDLTEALDAFRETGWAEGQAVLLQNLGLAHGQLGKLEAALPFHREALALYERTGSRYGAASVIGNLAIDVMQLGRLAEAAELARRCLATFAGLGSRQREALNVGNLGEIHRLMGEFGPARRCYRQALLWCQEIGDRDGEGVATFGLALIDSDLGRLAPARELLLAALRLSRETGNQRYVAGALAGLARVQYRCGELGPARRAGGQARELADQLGDAYLQVMVLLTLADLSRGGTPDDLARDSADQALELARGAGFRLLEGQARTARAELRLTGEDLDRAVGEGRQALAIHRETGHRPGEARTHTILGQALRRLGDVPVALDHEARARRLLAQLGLPEAGATAPHR